MKIFIHDKGVEIASKYKYFGTIFSTAHYGRLMHDMYDHARFDDLDLVLDLENVCKARPLIFILFFIKIKKILVCTGCFCVEHIYCMDFLFCFTPAH